MPSNKLNKMKHKADNLRTIEQLIFLLPDAAPDAALIKTEYANYIKNLKIILVGLLDSIHDFKTAGPVITGSTGYIKYIIDIYILPEANRISINSDIKKHIINWINGWNSVFNPNLGGFVNVPAHTQGHSGSIYEFISNATGHDDAEHFVALLLNVDSVSLNRYSTPMLRPAQANRTHNNHIAVVNDYSTRMDDCPHFLDSLYQVNVDNHGGNRNKFFTIRDNGFGSYIFHNRDTNAVPPALSLTDTIYTGPGKWDNGGNEQNVTNILNKKQQARGLDSNTGHFTIITRNILNRMRYVDMSPNTHADDTHADGGVFGFQKILIFDSFNKSDDSVIEFENKIFYGNNTSTIDYSTTVNLNFLKNLEKGLIKTGTQTLLNNVTSISKYDLQNALEPWFECAAWPLNNTIQMKGDAVINFALSQPEPSKRKNVMMLIGCLLDIKRSGDFMQSASVKCLENLFATRGQQQRQGIFATNDRIAGYISAKIHNNYTILSIKGSPLTMTAIWNASNNTTRHQGRAPIRPEDLTSTNKLVTVGGGNKRQKYGGNKGINMKNKKGGVFIPQKNLSASVNDFYWLLENITVEINKWKNTEHNTESHFVHTYNLAKYMYQFYGYIKEHQELIRNLFKIFFSNKITNFDDKPSILGTPTKEHALKNMSDLIDSQSQYGGLKQLLLEFMSSGAFKQIPNFIEKLDIIHLSKKEEISFVGSFADVKKVFLLGKRYTTTQMQMFSKIIEHVYEVYNPYIYILDVIFSYQRLKTIELIMKIEKTVILGTPALSSVVGVTDEVLESKTNALSLWVLENESVFNFDKESIMELLQLYYDKIYNLKDLATQLVDESKNTQQQEFHFNVKKGLEYYQEVQVNDDDYFKKKLNKIIYEVNEEARRLEENKPPLKRLNSDATSDGYGSDDSYGSDGSDEDNIPNKRIHLARVTHRQSDQAGGSTKVVFYSVKIDKLKELNKKLRKNKIKNKNKIEKNNKQINELKDKIKKEKQKEKEKNKKEKEKEKEKNKKEKQKEKEKNKKEKQTEKEKNKKEKQKETIKKQTKQPVKKETKQKEKVKKETKQKQQVKKTKR